MNYSDERLKEFEREVGSQPYSVVLNLIADLREAREVAKRIRQIAHGCQTPQCTISHAPTSQEWAELADLAKSALGEQR